MTDIEKGKAMYKQAMLEILRKVTKEGAERNETAEERETHWNKNFDDKGNDDDSDE